MLMFEGPYGRWDRARYELEHPEVTHSKDIWVRKLKQMLKHRAHINDPIVYMDKCPVWQRFFQIFEASDTISLKGLLEAMLLTGASHKVIADTLGNPDLPELFIAAYSEMFYNIRPTLGNEVMLYKHVMDPLLNYTGNKLAIKQIWKLFAYRGGMTLLMEAGMGKRPYSPEDFSALLHLGGMRNTTSMLHYISDGLSYLEDNPNALKLIGQLTTFEAERGVTHTASGYKRVEATSESEYSGALEGMFKMVKSVEAIEQYRAAQHEGFDVIDESKMEKC